MKLTLWKYGLLERFEVRPMAWANLFDFVKLADKGRTSGELEHHSTAANRLADFYNVKQHTMTSVAQEILKIQNENSIIFQINTFRAFVAREKYIPVYPI